MSKASDFNSLLKYAYKKYNSVDIFVNNAGVTEDGLIMRMNHEQWSKVIQTNLSSNYQIIKSLLPNMLSNKYGKIIHQRHSSKVYGNVVWLANEGVMLYPDFFHFEKPVGMHGYDNELKNSQGTAIIYKKDISNSYIKSLNLCDFNNLIMETLF